MRDAFRNLWTYCFCRFTFPPWGYSLLDRCSKSNRKSTILNWDFKPDFCHFQASCFSKLLQELLSDPHHFFFYGIIFILLCSEGVVVWGSFCHLDIRCGFRVKGVWLWSRPEQIHILPYAVVNIAPPAGNRKCVSPQTRWGRQEDLERQHLAWMEMLWLTATASDVSQSPRLTWTHPHPHICCLL